MENKRPVNLDLTQFKFPLPALTSIAHRITGVMLFVGLVFLMYGLDLSLSSEQGFAEAKALFDNALVKFIIWGVVSALLYHLVAGVKHLIMDLGVGETIEGGELGAQITIVLSVVLIVLAGVWIW
ncbi:succinate dehydrogenase, cytochrome b556 subunit [Oleiphilus sp. HI0009]|uniref:succinate dehydrogenase, cytochrome b556 subunit n=1 Tax=unclassified Oleiphilus TaxID=2631174 RepID=UPI0007C2F41B|nr:MULTISPECIES: succinate dehydrogenase, cytochrome b556 subunit [unclassified Oleiphilus]KZX74952.1 succinate dehydrogenase, cytochrome b556 subunit [Oleiphilus sp. HI0009]MCH2159197.1 succinate dehydrogenase, cytochrome b556 subunit [Oleiphilaceae bacterium]KZY68560.1 succinate dehydrogenase, cytochrome b556 subunit [Oleiphilus sp. HI0066]KZY69466.1 succinate dehydrogenase, cytochrome b556 subunit [Oleiphilus sp. HI0066]KZY75041.1 succinate dehydrogenase, cytochrome b556 subunit [Oleiphilus